MKQKNKKTSYKIEAPNTVKNKKAKRVLFNDYGTSINTGTLRIRNYESTIKANA